jgi:hypothetical protein
MPEHFNDQQLKNLLANKTKKLIKVVGKTNLYKFQPESLAAFLRQSILTPPPPGGIEKRTCKCKKTLILNKHMHFFRSCLITSIDPSSSVAEVQAFQKATRASSSSTAAPVTAATPSPPAEEAASSIDYGQFDDTSSSLSMVVPEAAFLQPPAREEVVDHQGRPAQLQTERPVCVGTQEEGGGARRRQGQPLP